MQRDCASDSVGGWLSNRTRLRRAARRSCAKVPDGAIWVCRSWRSRADTESSLHLFLEDGSENVTDNRSPGRGLRVWGLEAEAVAGVFVRVGGGSGG